MQRLGIIIICQIAFFIFRKSNNKKKNKKVHDIITNLFLTFLKLMYRLSLFEECLVVSVFALYLLMLAILLKLIYEIFISV